MNLIPLLPLTRPVLFVPLLGALFLCHASTSPANATERAGVTAALDSRASRIVVEAHATPAPVPVLYTAHVVQSTRVSAKEMTGTAEVRLRVLQGRPEVLTVGIANAEITGVTGEGLRDWAVRRGAGADAARRYLDLRFAAPSGAGQEGGTDLPREFSVAVQLHAAISRTANELALPIITRGSSSAFDWRAEVIPEPEVDVVAQQTHDATALERGGDDAGGLAFVSTGTPVVTVRVVRRGATATQVTWSALRFAGRAADNSIAFRGDGAAIVTKAGAVVPLLSGLAAWSGPARGDGWRVELERVGGNARYIIVFERAGTVNVAIEFVAAVQSEGEVRRVDFHLHAGGVVPVQIDGLGDVTVEDEGATAVMRHVDGALRGHVPADGRVKVGWKARALASDAGALFYTSTEQTDVRVSAGFLRQVAELRFRVAQGKLNELKVRVDGPGEILGVDGANVVGWDVVNAGTERMLVVRIARPLESETTISVRSQTTLDAFPVRTELLRLTPQGSTRHSGFVRVANAGAVRLEVPRADGLLQVPPAQFPGAAAEPGVRQVFVHRFPGADRRQEITASAVLPEVSVSQITTYTVAETTRMIETDLELDIREAPLRDWSVTFPAGHSVTAVRGAAVADYTIENNGEGSRTLRVLFKRAVQGRELLHVRLEKNESTAAGTWRLEPLRFPGARSVRGHIGVGGTAGFRLVPRALTQLVEMPLSLFPKPTNGLQHAFRLREPTWAAELGIEMVERTVHVDVFHLHTLKPGALSASVLLNYVIIGSPVHEMRIGVPADAGNIDVVGQGVRRDWRREANTVIVPFHQPSLGTVTLLLTFEQPLDARGGQVRMGEVRPLQVEAERGYVQLVSSGQVQWRPEKAEGLLLKLDALELPPELRLFTAVPALATYQYTGRPFELEIGVNAFAPAELGEQVVEYAQFDSKVARDGQVVTDAQLYVKSRGRKALRFELPAAVQLWEARVDGERVTARSDGSWTVLPLPPRRDPNEPAAVQLRLGQPAGGGRGPIVLTAPKLAAPLVFSTWTLHADGHRRLVPVGGTALLDRPNLTETGFEWLAQHADASLVVLLFAGSLLVLVAWWNSPWRSVVALVAAVVATAVAVMLAREAWLGGRANVPDLAYSSVMVPADGTLSVHVRNVPAWLALVSPMGVLATIAGLVSLVLARRVTRAVGQVALRSSGVVLAAGGLLAQRGGAGLLFSAAAVACVLAGWPTVRDLVQRWRAGRGDAGAEGAAASLVPLIMLLVAGTLGLGVSVDAMAASAPGTSPAAAIDQTWDIKDGRLRGSLDLTVRANAGDTFTLLRAPAVLTSFTSSALRVVPLLHGDQTFYTVVADKPGEWTARATFECAIKDATDWIPVLTGLAVTHRLTVQLEQPGWDVVSSQAVQVQRETLAEGSRTRLVLAPEADAEVQIVPMRRDPASETPRFFAELNMLFLPGPGAVSATARAIIRPAQGRIATVDLQVPAGYVVADVGSGPVGMWRFDPQSRVLRISVQPAQETTFSLMIAMQAAATGLPFETTLLPAHVVGAAGQFGSVAVAGSADAQPENLRPNAMTGMSLDDFDRELLPRPLENTAGSVVQAVYRYAGDGASIALRVAPVLPEVRVEANHRISIGDDRLVVASELGVTITRVGLFSTSFLLPAGLDLESVSGPGLSHWTEVQEAGDRIVTLHFQNRTLGTQQVAVSLTGAAPKMGQTWTVPVIRIREATRQAGELRVVPERGLRLRLVERSNATELDPRTLPGAALGALAFHLLDGEARVTLNVEALEPWITAQVLQEITAREGQTATRVGIALHVENAAVKQLRLHLPTVSTVEGRTLQATGAAVADLVPVHGEPDQWDLRFQRGIIGQTDVQLEFQASAIADGGQPLTALRIPSARQVEHFVAVRGAGRMEVDVLQLPTGWQRVDWAAVPARVQDRADRSVPTHVFRLMDVAQSALVVARRHQPLDALKLRVTEATLTSLVSPRGRQLTRVELGVALADTTPLRVRLPEGALLFNAFVNGEGVPVLRDGADILFRVSGSAGDQGSARVVFVYAHVAPEAGESSLAAPRLSVPLENLTWRVVLPPGYRLAAHRGDLRLCHNRDVEEFGLAEYRAELAATRAQVARRLDDFVETANTLIERGRPTQATELLARAAKVTTTDASTNEDARVQWRALRTQQTVVGLNTRRQRLALGAAGESGRTEQLEQAAGRNPVMRGQLDFDTRELDQLLMGNSVEENTALRGIAARLVAQQLASESGTTAIDLVLPVRGEVISFERSLQVNPAAPLALHLSLRPTATHRLWLPAGLLLTLGLLATATRRPSQPVRDRHQTHRA